MRTGRRGAPLFSNRQLASSGPPQSWPASTGAGLRLSRRSRLSLAKPWGHTMPRRCTVCAHPKVEAIDMALVAGEPYRSVANRYESLSQAAVQRHEENHLPATLSKAKEAQDTSRADDLLASLRGLQRRALSILGKAEEAGELRTAPSAIREARGNLELLAKLSGELQQEGTVNLHLSPEYLEVRTAILVAVEPYPEAAQAISRAMLGIEGNGHH